MDHGMSGLLALIVAALFAGAALYVSVVEHPARLGLDDRAAVLEWRPAYKRGTWMQAPLAIAGFILGVIAWWQTRETAFALGAVAMIANWPWTLLAILPTNKQLLATALSGEIAGSRPLLEKWGQLHAIRTGLGLLATLAFLVALV